jgi:hypothetical protein
VASRPVVTKAASLKGRERSLPAAGDGDVVAFTRMYLGVHCLSDVGAAFCEGIAWLSLCLIAIDRFWPRRHEAHHDMHGIA